MRRLHGRRAGVAMPMAIMLIGFITAGIIGAFTRLDGEARTVDSGRTTTLAFSLAEAGLEEALALRQAVDSARYGYQDGWADVRLDTLMVNGANALVLVRSTGTVSGGRPDRPGARRAVAQLAIRIPASLDADAAWTSLSGLRKNGTSGMISGVDECNPSNVVAGASTPNGMFELKTQGKSGEPFEGAPGVDTMSNQVDLSASVGIDWAGITNPAAPAITPTFTVCMPGTDGYDPGWPNCGAFPTEAQMANYPVVLVNGSITLGSGEVGQGLLIVTGALRFTGGTQTWKGIILVGRELTDNGTGYVSGAAITGLDVKVGIEVGESEIVEEAIANGTKRYQYNSCEIANALRGLAGLTPIPNAWIDNWSTW